MCILCVVFLFTRVVSDIYMLFYGILRYDIVLGKSILCNGLKLNARRFTLSSNSIVSYRKSNCIEILFE